MTCGELEDLAAELALGTVSGAERAAALDHLAGCPACRELVDQLARAADNLLLLAPVAEPPPGFESRVLTRLGVARAPVPLGPSRRRRVLVAAAAMVLTAAVSGAGVSLLADDERPPELRTALIQDDEGRWTCRSFVYGEDPTWLVVSLDRTDGLNAAYTVEAVRRGGADPVPVCSFSLQDGHGSFTKAVQMPADDVRGIRVLDSGGRVRYEMTFPTT